MNGLERHIQILVKTTYEGSPSRETEPGRARMPVLPWVAATTYPANSLPPSTYTPEMTGDLLLTFASWTPHGMCQRQPAETRPGLNLRN